MGEDYYVQDYERDLFLREIERLKMDFKRCPDESTRNSIHHEIIFLREVIKSHSV